MTPSRTCAQCGTELKVHGLGGLCPRCVGKAVLAPDEEVLDTLVATEAGGQAQSVAQEVTGSPEEPDLEVVSGRYRLTRLIGEGGFGEVFLAEQLKPVKRQVALKILKLGMDSKQIVTRFEAERQALAVMDHPHIAKVHDAGVKASGRPYFVMEWVQGIKVTDFCRTNQLPTRDRLELFIKICQAVQHAHQKGIIHRDIKPSNILVAFNEGVPEPKVIDFGIAKAVGGLDLTDKTLVTTLHQFLGTPTYMSPEQVVMGGVDVDTRTDIYSLGVLLYELLTGRTPFDAKAVLERGIDDLIHTLRNVEPSRPSTRVKTLGDDDLTTLAQYHRTYPSQLIHQIRGDLDWIVMKCLEKDRTRRYETANALAMDVQRHLSSEPVLARPPSKLYEFQKTVRRHKFGFAATAAIILILAIGIVLTTWQAIRAGRSEREQTRLSRQSEVRAYAADMNLAQRALSEHNLGRVKSLLYRYQPSPNSSSTSPDLRGWEWRYLWQQSRGEPRKTLRGPSLSEVLSLSVSADGKWLAIGDLWDDLTLWDLSTKTKRTTVWDGHLFPYGVFSPTASLLAFATPDSVHLWDASIGKTVAEMRLNGQCTRLAFSSDGSRLITFVNGSKDSVLIWKIPDGTLVRSAPVAGIAGIGRGHQAAVNRDLTTAAYTVEEGGAIRVIDPYAGAKLWTAVTTEDAVVALEFSADGTLLAGGTGWDKGVIYLWKVDTGELLARWQAHRGFINKLVFWPDGTKLASAGTDQVIALWDLTNLPTVPEPILLTGHQRPVKDMILLPDNRTLASGSEEGTVYLWDTAADRSDQTHMVFTNQIVAWRFQPDSQAIITANTHGRVMKRRGTDFQDSEVLLDTARETGFACFSQDLRWIATCSPSGNMQIWNLAMRKLLRGYPIDTAGLAPRALLSQGKGLLLYDHKRHKLIEWELPSGRETGSWSAREKPYVGILSPDDRWMIRIQENGGIMLTDRLTKQDYELQPIMRGYEAAAFSADGRYVAVTSTRGFARVWETATKRHVNRFGNYLMGVYAATFSPDGNRFVGTSTGDESIKLWDMESLEELLTLPAKNSAFLSTQFSPDGNVLGALDYAKGLHLWRAPASVETEVAEKR